jgi:death on curing protein
LSADPLFLSEEEVVGIHDEQIRLFGGLAGLADANLLSSAVMQPQHAYFYGGKRSLFDLAAEYAFSISKNHAFNDGNKRTAAASAIAFLDVNNWLVQESFTKEIVALVKGEISKGELSATLERISKRRQRIVIDLVEELQRLMGRH